MAEIYVARVNRRNRAGRYMPPRVKFTREKYHAMEERTFQGETVHGVSVSTYPASWCFGVILKNAKGRKLLSKHETLVEAAEAAGRYV